MRRVIFNQKGGVGKSTIATNLAAIGAERGRKTLLIDLDTLGNSSRYLLGDDWLNQAGNAADFFNELLTITYSPKGLAAYAQPTQFDNLAILAAHPDLANMMNQLDARYKINKLKKALEDLPEYDDVWIDTPPALNFYSMSALIAAQACLIPFDCDDFARQALYGLIQTVQDIREDHNPQLHIEGIIVNQFQARAKLPQTLIEEMAEEGLPLMQNKIARSVKVSESHQRALPLVHLDKKHKVAQQFSDLYGEITKEDSPVLA